MKFSKKLLTALLPIAATGAIAPAVTSCNKGNGYNINFGDEVNCLDEKGTNYHSLNDVKNAIKWHTSPEPKKTIGVLNLPNWTQAKQQMYYDLIASLSLVCEFKFHLKYDPTSEDKKLVLNYEDKDGKSHECSGNNLQYLPADAVTKGPQQINICLGSNEDGKFKSFNYQNTKAVGA